MKWDTRAHTRKHTHTHTNHRWSGEALPVRVRNCSRKQVACGQQATFVSSRQALLQCVCCRRRAGAAMSRI